MIITAFTIAKDLEEAERLVIKKFYGDLCKDCNTIVRYTSNNNCVKCGSERSKKSNSGKSPKVKGEFYCKCCMMFRPVEQLGRTVTNTRGSWSQCITHYEAHKARHAARQKPAHLRTKAAP